MSVCHVLFDMKAGMSFPGLYAFSDWRSWSRGYVWFYLGFVGFYLIFYELYSFVIKIKCSKKIFSLFLICGFYNKFIYWLSYPLVSSPCSIDFGLTLTLSLYSILCLFKIRTMWSWGGTTHKLKPSPICLQTLVLYATLCSLCHLTTCVLCFLGHCCTSMYSNDGHALISAL